MTYEIPPEAHRLHAEGRSAGSRGDYDQALTLLGRAAALAPDWPYPPYDAAFTYLMRGDTRAAQNLYERVANLSPSGFFTCRTTLDMLRREHAGQLSAGILPGLRPAGVAGGPRGEDTDPARHHAALPRDSRRPGRNSRCCWRTRRTG